MLEFEWDAAKASANETKHGVSFEEATRAFDDPRLVLAEDVAHSEHEERYLAFGKLHRGVLTVRFVVRGDCVRIIGAGYWRKGKAYYEEANRLHG